MQNHKRLFGLGLATLASLALAPAADAQQVSADIRIGAGPVDGIVRIGEPAYYRPRHVVIDRGPRVIVVEHRRGWNPRKVKNYRVLEVYYDRGSRSYYDGYRRGFDRVRVYHDGRRFYRYDDDRYDRRDRDDRYDRRDRDDRYDREHDGWHRKHERDRGRDHDRDRDRRDRDRRDRDRGDWDRRN